MENQARRYHGHLEVSRLLRILIVLDHSLPRNLLTTAFKILGDLAPTSAHTLSSSISLLFFPELPAQRSKAVHLPPPFSMTPRVGNWLSALFNPSPDLQFSAQTANLAGSSPDQWYGLTVPSAGTCGFKAANPKPFQCSMSPLSRPTVSSIPGPAHKTIKLIHVYLHPGPLPNGLVLLV